MLKKTFALGLLSFAALGFVSVPAQADTAVVQTSTQDTYIEGAYNGSGQMSDQINIHRSKGKKRGSTGVVQDVYQRTTVLGNDNRAIQSGRQVNVIERRNGRKTRVYVDHD